MASKPLDMLKFGKIQASCHLWVTVWPRSLPDLTWPWSPDIYPITSHSLQGVTRVTRI